MHPGRRETLSILAVHEATVKKLLQPEVLQSEISTSSMGRIPQSYAGSSRSFGLAGLSRLPGPSSGILSSSSLSTSLRNAHFLESLGKKGSRFIRRRCVVCYQNLLDDGRLAPYARAKAKRVSTRCTICNKTYCIDCFSKVEVHR